MKHFNPGDIVVGPTNSIIRVEQTINLEIFIGTVLISDIWVVGHYGSWQTDVFKIHIDLTRLAKLERVFANEI